MKKILTLFIIILLNISTFSQETALKKCPSCGFIEKRKEAIYCINCGSKLKLIVTVPILMCPKCNKPLDKDGKFCAFCGAKGELKHIEVPSKPEDINPLIKIKEIKKIEKSPLKEKLKIEDLFFTKSTYLEEHFLNRKKETARKVLISCVTTYHEFISFYENIFNSKAKVIKISNLNYIFTVIRIKFKTHEEFEIILYSSQEIPNSELWERGAEKINEKFEEQMEPVNKIDREINAFKKFVEEGKTTAISVENHIKNLENKKTILMSSPSYWDVFCMKKVIDLKKDVIFLNQVTVIEEEK